MAIIETNNLDVKGLQGLHLYHMDTSCCAQRVRFVLNEKDLEWQSHYIDLRKQQNLSSDYLSINPNGVVPTLVHDGVVVIESNDIIQYLDEAFPTIPMMPAEAAERQIAEALIARSGEAFDSIVVLSFEFLFKPGKKDFRSIPQRYKEIGIKRQKTELMQEFVSRNGFRRERIESAVKHIEADLRHLEEVLSKQAWLTGNEFGLADIAWATLAHRLYLLGYPSKSHANVNRWYRSVSERGSFQSSILDWQPKAVAVFAKTYGVLRQLIGTGIGATQRQVVESKAA